MTQRRKRRYAVLFALFACWFSYCFSLAPASAQTASNGVTAHRGDSVRCPENTLDAFRRGIEAGCDWIETDVYRTADGRLVLCHDPTTLRTAGQELRIADATLAELRALDMAAQFRAKNNLDEISCAKQTIPTLEEALDLILTEKKARLSLQPKDDCVDEIVRIIRGKNAENWVGFNDGSLEKMSRAKELLPEAVIFWDRHHPDLAKDIPIAVERNFHALVLHQSDVAPEAVQAIRGAGLVPGAWTVNEVPTMKRCLDLGIERIYTDDPETLFRVKAERSAP